MQKVFKKVFIILLLPILFFTLSFFTGCLGPGSVESKTTESSDPEGQKMAEDSTSESDVKQEDNVPLPPDEANGLFVIDDLCKALHKSSYAK